MKPFLLFFLLSFSLFTHAQTAIPARKIELLIGRSIHGTGDMRGLSYATEYLQRFKKRFSWSVGIGGTLHDGSSPLFYTDPSSGRSNDGSVRYTTAGVQITGNFGYSFIRTIKHDLIFRLGPLLRYQTSSYPDAYTIYYPPATRLPQPVVVFENTTPQRTFAFGGLAQFQYTYALNGKLVLGLLGGLQTDTNGDTIAQTALTIGRQF